jgi:hypothetical protein
MQHKFVPTPTERNFVTLLAGAKMGQEQIRGQIVNARSGRAISRATFARAFKAELATAKTRLQATVLSKYYEALMRGDAWAIQWGLRHWCGYHDNGLTLSIGDHDGPNAIDDGIQISFVRPTRDRDAEDRRAEAASSNAKLVGGPVIDHSQFNGGGSKP